MNMPSFFCKIIHVETKVIPQFFLFMILLYMHKSRRESAAFVCLGALNGGHVLNFYVNRVNFAHEKVNIFATQVKNVSLLFILLLL